MTLHMMEGFDLYNGVGTGTGAAVKWVRSGGSWGVSAGRFGGQCMDVSGAGSGLTVYRGIPGSMAQGTLGFAARSNSLHTAGAVTRPVIWMRSTGTFMLGMSFDASGVINVWRLTSQNAGVALITTPVSTYSIAQWDYYEIEFVISDTVGLVNLYQNGALLGTFSGDTQGGVPTTVNEVGFGIGSTNGGSTSFDDLYWIDVPTKLGERKITVIRPNADTAQKDWTPSTGVLNYACVDDTLADTTDWVTSSVVSDEDLYDLNDLGFTPTVIDAIQVDVWAVKTDATTRAIAAVLDYSGSQLVSPDMNLAATVNKFEYMTETKPGGGAWDPTAINSLQSGPRVTV